MPIVRNAANKKVLMADELQGFADAYAAVVDELNNLLYDEILPRSTNSVTREANRVQSVYSLTAESKQAPQYKTQILHL